MGVHGTCEEALANVAAFVDASTDEDRQVVKSPKHARSKSGKHSKSSKSYVSSKDTAKKGKDRKDKDQKKKSRKGSKSSKHSRHGKKAKDAGSSDDDSSSGSEGPVDLEAQLAKGREAVRCLRTILACWPELRKDLREILWRLDQGKALDIASIPDAGLRAQLAKLFDNLQLTRTKQGVYGRSKTGSPVLTFLGPIFEESPAEPSSAVLAATRPAAAPQGNGTLPSNRPTDLADQAPAAGSAHEPHADNGARSGPQVEAAAREASPEGRDAGADQGHTRAQSGQTLRDGRPQAHVPQPDVVIGPDMGPIAAAPPDDGDQVDLDTAVDVANGNGMPHAGDHGGDADMQREGLVSSGEDDDRDDQHRSAAQRARPVAGPAMPPPELLAAAAAVAAEMLEAESFELVGPAPPELVAEIEVMGDDERSTEVVRVLRLLEAGKQKPEGPDAYEVVGVDPKASASEIKKRYWRLSLLIHPDKCGHPRANEAFQAVSKAAKALQDAGRRRAIDAQREDDVLRRHAEAVAQQAERERQWRVVRGEATAEDLAGPIRAPGPAARESWMTELPAERRAKQPSQKNQTTFAKTSIQGRGDTSSWTDTPAQRLARLTAGPAGAAAALPSTLSAADQRKAAETAQLVDRYNASSRRKTLVEQHQERLQAQKQQKKKKRKAEGQAEADTGDAAWEGSHPWRPFDREKDLAAGPPTKGVSKEELMKQAGTLGGRFGDPAKTQRHFL